MKLIDSGHIDDGQIKREGLEWIQYKGQWMDMVGYDGRIEKYKDRFGTVKVELDTETGKYNFYEKEAGGV